MTVFEKGLITMLGCNSLFVLISVPLALRKVPRNVVYGFRTRSTLSDDSVWYEANAHFGRGMIKASLISSIGIVVLYLSGISPAYFLIASIVILVVPQIAATAATFRFIRSLPPGGSQHTRFH